MPVVGITTFTVQVAETFPSAVVQVIFAVPTLFVVTRPSAFTDATALFEVDQERVVSVAVEGVIVGVIVYG